MRFVNPNVLIYSPAIHARSMSRMKEIPLYALLTFVLTSCPIKFMHVESADAPVEEECDASLSINIKKKSDISQVIYIHSSWLKLPFGFDLMVT